MNLMLDSIGNLMYRVDFAMEPMMKIVSLFGLDFNGLLLLLNSLYGYLRK